MKLKIPPPKTPDGRIYRYSPNPEAHPRHFVLGEYDRQFVVTDEARARMKLQPRTTQSVCPYSGIIAPDDDFLHPDDKDAVLKIVEDAAMRDVEAAINKAFGGLNSRSSGKGLINITTTFTPARPRPKPRFGRRDLLRELVCDHCSRDYGVFAISLFCHDCGAPNVRLHFAREVELVEMQVELATVQSEAAAELSYRLLGNAHEDVLTAFEATQKAVYLSGKNKSSRPRKNLSHRAMIFRTSINRSGVSQSSALIRMPASIRKRSKFCSSTFRSDISSATISVLWTKNLHRCRVRRASAKP